MKFPNFTDSSVMFNNFVVRHFSSGGKVNLYHRLLSRDNVLCCWKSRVSMFCLEASGTILMESSKVRISPPFSTILGKTQHLDENGAIGNMLGYYYSL